MSPSAQQDDVSQLLTLDSFKSQVAASAYDYYAAYTGIKLPLPKLDMVAVPGRTHSEPHWGLALFDERRFLFNGVRRYFTCRHHDRICV